MRGGLKDFAIAFAWALFADFIAQVIQHVTGGHWWLPDGSYTFGFTFASLWFSRHPIWARRWQPINAAPRDGTPIIGRSPDGVCYICWWPIKSTFGRAGAWAFYDDPAVGRFSFHPTHWMPLPEPPEGDA